MFEQQRFPVSPVTEQQERTLSAAIDAFDACRNSCSMAEAERVLSEARRRMTGLYIEFRVHQENRRHAVRFDLPATARVATVSMRLAHAQYRKARRQAIEARAAYETLIDQRTMLAHLTGEDSP